MDQPKENSDLTLPQENFRRGSTEYHKKKVLTARKIIEAIRETPGLTRDQILAKIGETSGYGGFESLTRNKLAYFVKGSEATWYPTQLKNPQP